MPSRSRCLLASYAAGLGTLVGLSLPANAQSNGERAIALGTEALGFYSAQKFVECADGFAKAHALSPSPVFQLYEARCLRGAGKYVAARAQMREVTETSVAEDAPGPWRQALLDAKAELPQLEKTIPSIVISAPGAKPEGLILRVDGAEAKLGATIDLDPGPHKVTAAYGADAREAVIDLKHGQKGEAVVLSFEASKPGPELPPKATSTGGPGIVPGAVVAALGGGAVVAAAVFGGLAIGEYGDLEGCGVNEADELVCVGGQPGDVGAFDSANLMADLSTGLFIAGGVTLAVGIVLMIALPGEEAATALIPGGFRF